MFINYSISSQSAFELHRSFIFSCMPGPIVSN